MTVVEGLGKAVFEEVAGDFSQGLDEFVEVDVVGVGLGPAVFHWVFGEDFVATVIG